MGVRGQRHAPVALPPGKSRYPSYRRLDGPQGLSGRVRKISPPPGFDPRTVQTVAQSLYQQSYPGSLYIYIYIYTHIYLYIYIYISSNIKYKSTSLLFLNYFNAMTFYLMPFIIHYIFMAMVQFSRSN